jgi:hypothetical protein
MEKGYQIAIEKLGEIILQQENSLSIKEYELQYKQKENDRLKEELEEFKRKVERIEGYVKSQKKR